MENPFPYPLCDRTVTVYRETGERTVCEGCYFVYEDVENESAQGLQVDRKFLLVMPGAQRVFAGDRIFDGIGPEEIVWAEFVPAAVPGLCQAAYAKAWYWDGHVCHTEAGRK